LALSSALIAGLALAGCRAEGVDGPVVAAQELVPVRVAEVAAADQAEMLHFAGSARARQRASLTFQVGGTLASRPLQLGQAVAAGDVLATLYNPQLEPARDAARARLAELQLQVLIEEMLQRDIQLETSGEIERAAHPFLAIVNRVPVRLG
jgi:multidrug efflux pump subunit AcrA (membrane-fusion protein)